MNWLLLPFTALGMLLAFWLFEGVILSWLYVVMTGGIHGEEFKKTDRLCVQLYAGEGASNDDLRAGIKLRWRESLARVKGKN